MKESLWLLVACCCLTACQTDAPSETLTVEVLEGETMGTYYRISYVGTPVAELKSQLDSVLVALNLQVSTYIDSSTISRFNQSDSGIVLTETDDHFRANFALAQSIYQATEGAFDPTVMPLVNYWGFGYQGETPITAVDSATVDSLRQFVGFDTQVVLEENFLRKMAPGVQMDLSATAKGYGVDLLGQQLEQRGIEAYLVDIGGEVVARGQKPDGSDWRIGINTPKEEAALSDIEIALPLRDQAIATSGNYRNYREINGRKYAHTINPNTGFPERNELLSASVFTRTCAEADGFATACMVLGDINCMRLIGDREDVDVYLIIGSEDGGMQPRYTENLAPAVETAKQ